MDNENLIKLLKAQSEMLVNLSERVQAIEAGQKPEPKDKIEEPTDEEMDEIFELIKL